IGISTSETGFNSPGDGLLGLAFNSISNIASVTGGNGNYIDALGLSGSKNQFAFYMSNAADGDVGEVSIGGVDSSKFTGTPVYIPLNSETYWQFSFSKATFSVGSTTGAAVGSTTNAICDTGTTLTIMDAAPANAINKAIGAGAYDSSQGIYPIDCGIASTGPTIYLNFGGGKFPINASEYVISNTGGSPACFSGITQGAADSGVVILGDTFIRGNYAIFDKANNRKLSAHQLQRPLPTAGRIVLSGGKHFKPSCRGSSRVFAADRNAVLVHLHRLSHALPIVILAWLSLAFQKLPSKCQHVPKTASGRWFGLVKIGHSRNLGMISISET
ncbi:hypothetical protein HDU91_006941, partial [Kappamyces sp. JEL0680]